ncbi:uncharacterized protein [Nicotiana sylvestris]|uniref:Transmembrane protein n=2 Tax=Nicotiana TaxID=4085 RepID=A0A1S4AXW0_TOBAC|nr:PREDICTED: uncharacterized protein LOC104217780 [Nicotiana sylvestris]XP_016481394.1 PREDICTED: uncharacterized protein LOC107802411 [Nicotiana tabacum]
MDDYNYGSQTIETAKKPNIYNELIKKTLQFLVLVSLIFFLLYYTYGFSFFFTYNFHFSALVFPLFAHGFDRKYMFLLCNAILAFLAKNLSCTSSSSSRDEEQEYVLIKGKEEVEENKEEVAQVEETAACLLVSDTETVEEGNEVNMSIEELNKKIEEFIRKMKEEIRTEAMHSSSRE